MKAYIIAIATFLTFSFGFSQTFKTEHGKSFKKESEKDIYNIVFPSPYGFMTLHHLDNVMMDNIKAMVLTKYDQTFQAIDSKTFNLPKLGLRASDLRRVIETDDQLLFLSTVMDKKSKLHQLNAQVYTQADNSVSDNTIIASFDIEGYSKSGFFNIATSPDQSKIAIVANLPFEKKSNEKVKIWVYDTSLNLLWNQSETLNYSSERAYNEEVFVDNTGKVSMVKVTDEYKKTRKSEILNFNGNSVETIEFSSDGFMPMSTELIDVNGKSMLTGFYWNGKKAIIKINEKEGQDNDGAYLYDLNLNKLIGIHQWSSTINSEDLKSLAIVDTKVIGDEIYVFGEKQLTDSAFRKSGNSMSTELDYFYTYGSSIIVNMDTKGTLKGFTPLFKEMKLKNHQKEIGSFTALNLENGIRVLSNYNDRSSLNSFYTDNNITYLKPKVRLTDHSIPTTPNILPKTVVPVKNYGIVYYITKLGDQYWLNKMTW
ncbi:hypothetical protein [Winogradskyella endarachnes]|uniref:Uncharacterized protein n=1 Tax=Winogradskyella endarachnes TaxID=2681965 RepID=A0A6L6U5R2_9FLAO|nr:hypothetical protein [Winogradskyella endarachnes]MUU77545.1 hypothetical protein [Winogradskyella endarachnes]